MKEMRDMKSTFEKKTLTTLIVIALLLAPAFPLWRVRGQAQDMPPAQGRGPSQELQHERITAKQRRALESYSKAVSIEFGEQGVPSYLMGKLAEREAQKDPVAEARSALKRHGDAFRRNPDDDFVYRTQETDEQGMTHVRMGQTYKGLPVVGGELIVHLTKDKVAGINGRFVADLDFPTEPALTGERAAEQALSFIKNEGEGKASVVEMRRPVIFTDAERVRGLALPVQVQYDGPQGVEVEDLFIDAFTGEVLGRHPLVWRAKSLAIYNGNRSCDQKTLPGTLMGLPGNPLDEAGLAALNGTSTTYDYYWNTFRRDSYDGNGAQLVSTVHFSSFTQNLVCEDNNAAWFSTGRQMAYGDGDGRTFGNLANGLDITAHELSHAVVNATANLTYSGESGALNEATADILGESAAFYAGRGDWLIGAEVYTPGTANDALRYMNDPARDAGQFGLTSSDFYPLRYTGTVDKGGVHFNSGIANLFFYLLSQGGRHPRNRSNIYVTGIGIDKAQRIWYRALTVYMTATTNFQGALRATRFAAADLYGAYTTEWFSVVSAWAAVGVFELLSAPAAVSWGSNRLDVFAQGADGACWHRAWDGSAWTPWESLGGITIIGAPAVSSRGYNTLDVFVRGTNNLLYQKVWDGSNWSGWILHDGPPDGGLASAPAAVSWTPSRVDVFARGTDNQVHQKFWDGYQWSGWVRLGGGTYYAPAVSSRGLNRLDVFVRGTDDQLYQKSLAGGWSDWVPVPGGLMASAPAAFSRDRYEINVFTRGTDNGCYGRSFQNFEWYSWSPLGGATYDAPAVASPAWGRLDVFVRGLDNTLYQNTQNGYGSNWSGWAPIP
jgi:Zn-dependent metalloprotease